MVNEYEYISMIARCGSLVKAAEKLYITSSALSKYLLKVEEEHGLSLFDRMGKRMVLTHAGERYLHWQEQIHLMQEDMHAELRDLSRNDSGLVRLGLQMSDSGLMAKHILPLFCQRYPNVRLEVHEDYSQRLISMVEDSLLDFAILPFTAALDRKRDLICTRLASNYPVLLVNRNNPLTGLSEQKTGFPHPWIDYRCLKDEKFILPHSDAPIHTIFERLKAECGFEPQVLIHAKNMRTHVNCVRQGLGICPTLDFAISSNFAMDELALLSFGSPSEPDITVTIHNKGHYLTEPVLHLMRLFRKVVTSFEQDLREWPHPDPAGSLPPRKAAASEPLSESDLMEQFDELDVLSLIHRGGCG